ncbi:MAG: hypothetical protein KUL83_04635 [Lentimicrobium sp.]|nr:hypothetical protein [Lentimicrobium sp.]MDD2526833.1 hypothetical protein [Lentimicrobiaceae bacterium]MDD4598099.1 hypothetical protein [Lentimicrobiaceae bacterium]MDY0024446.1 hypothetical protein [Lentimicrobium sp.]
MILLRYNRILILLILFLPTQSVFAQRSSTSYLKAAIEATNKKKYTEAIRFCDTAVKINSTFVEAYFHRGFNKLKLKDYTGARVDFTICLELNRNSLSAYLYRAYTNQKLGNTWEAGQDYLSARKIDALETLAFFTLNLFRSGV